VFYGVIKKIGGLQRKKELQLLQTKELWDWPNSNDCNWTERVEEEKTQGCSKGNRISWEKGRARGVTNLRGKGCMNTVEHQEEGSKSCNLKSAESSNRERHGKEKHYGKPVGGGLEGHFITMERTIPKEKNFQAEMGKKACLSM